MPAEDQLLLKKAAEATETAYAPYSKFKVGAAALLSNGAVITGTNQENASFPVGICAERVLLSAANAIHPGTSILKIAISYRSSNKPDDEPVFPCGICRQSLLEQEVRQQSPVSLILAGATGEVFIIERSSDLIPFGFTNQNLA
ncbi:MAG: cytidine deaminase [Chitinophagaceae bacterium]|nr:cytidine deaminase [Chitinophagaceae bacterium]MCW5926514.1 cytidine deaminase [Chitinophagaceae bacterium]